MITGLIVGALLSLGAVGTRGFHFFTAFIVSSGFVIGVGLLVNIAFDKHERRKAERQDRTSLK